MMQTALEAIAHPGRRKMLHRALKLWLSLRYHGLGQFREAIREDLRHPQLLTQLIDAEPSLERLAPKELSAVCFRWNGGPE